MTRVANAEDCYRHLSQHLTRDSTNSIKWDECKSTRSSKIKEKTTWTTDSTYVCLGVDDEDECARLTTSPADTSPNHIFFINRNHVPDMQPIKDTQKTY